MNRPVFTSWFPIKHNHQLASTKTHRATNWGRPNCMTIYRSAIGVYRQFLIDFDCRSFVQLIILLAAVDCGQYVVCLFFYDLLGGVAIGEFMARVGREWASGGWLEIPWRFLEKRPDAPNWLFRASPSWENPHLFLKWLFFEFFLEKNKFRHHFSTARHIKCARTLAFPFVSIVFVVITRIGCATDN